MIFILAYCIFYCLRNGLPLDMDVYDAAEWSSIVDLSAQSVINGSSPVEISDFTRGNWDKLDSVKLYTDPQEVIDFATPTSVGLLSKIKYFLQIK
jgi:hypothetical protein